MLISMRSIRGAAAGAMGAGALTGVMLFGAIPEADAAPAPAPATNFAVSGFQAGPGGISDIPQSPAFSPTRWGHGGGGGFGHGGFGRGGWGHGGGFGRGGWGRGGWGRGGWGGGWGRGGGIFNHGRFFRPWW